MTVTKHLLDEIAGDYHTSKEVPDKFIEDALQVNTLPWLRSALQGCEHVLELGYGEGIVTDDLVSQGKKLTTIEGSSKLVDLVRKKYGARVTCVHALFEQFEPAQPYEAILASHVLEHVDDPVALLVRMKSWLQPGGRLVVIVPNSESIHRRLAVLMGLQPALDSLSARDKLVGHQRVYSLRGLRSDLTTAGYEIVSEQGFFLKTLPNSMMLGYSPQLIQAMNAVSNDLPPQLLANLGVVASLHSP